MLTFLRNWAILFGPLEREEGLFAQIPEKRKNTFLQALTVLGYYVCMLLYFTSIFGPVECQFARKI